MDLLQLLANGIPAGIMYGLVAMGIILIHNGTNVVHFGYGEQITLAAYSVIILQVVFGAPLPLAVLGAFVVSCLFALVCYFGVMAPLRRSPLLVQLIATLAIGMAVREGLRAYMGPDPWPFPTFVPSRVFDWGGVFVTSANLAAVGAAVVIAGLLFSFFRFTKYGKAMLAASENPRGAQLVGVPILAVFAAIWLLAAVLAAASAMLLTPIVGLTPDMCLIAIKGFCAAILGGFTSLPGAIVGGILLGLFETSAGYFISSAAKDAVAFAALIVVVILRPNGLLGRVRMKKV